MSFLRVDVHESVVVVIGASSATGIAQSLLLRRSGHRVLGLVAEPLADEKEFPFEPIVIVFEKDIREAVRKLLLSVHRVHAVIACPPPFLLAASDELNAKEVQGFFAEHLSRTLEIETMLLEHMRAAGGGNLINIVLPASRGPSICLGLYRAAEAAICAWSDAASKELASLRVFVSVVESSKAHPESARVALSMRPLKRRDDERLESLKGLIAKDRYWIGEEMLAEKVKQILQVKRPKAYYRASRTVWLQTLIGRLLRLRLGIGQEGGSASKKL